MTITDIPGTQVVTIDHLEVPLRVLAQQPVHSPDHHLEPWIARHCRIPLEDVRGYEIERRSLDARKKPDLRFVYQLVARVREDSPVHEAPGTEVRTDPPRRDDGLHHLATVPDLPLHPIVVGTGPAGIMAAYLLAMYGCKPLIIDRGRDVDRRTADLDRFHDTRRLDPESNYLYGEGGAGTYSDGKLYTRAKDRRMRFLLEAFVAARAPRHILWRHHPHVGSDILPHMCKRLRKQIEAWGGTFRWDTTVTDILESGGRCAGVRLADGERIDAPLVLMAPGHSARDLIVTLAKRGIAHRAKGFQLGCRVEHDQRLIDLGQYGCEPPKHLLGAAEYNLVSRPPAHTQAGSVTTFCMCPGGEILAATSEPNQLSTNGMSRFARASRWANAGLIVNQEVDYAGDGLAGFAFIDAIERAAFAAGGSDYTCPAQGCAAFVRGEDGPAVRDSSYQLGVRPGRIDRLLPEPTTAAIRQALLHFERIIPGFLKHGSLVGVETRISSPVRFDRDPATLASSLPGLYLGGEGAGYAGGIVSAGLDGLRLAETILTGVPAKREKEAAFY
ncbi:MAG: FAD-dependent monooxygenase [Planctomycetes bacterium]|nr:FAD-dependent monooxygenase [Planctomycetota bacterium]